MSSFEIISDYSKANLTEIPERILDMTNLKMLFLEKNMLMQLSEDFFSRLPNLMWLDLRNNQLEELPRSIAHHKHLEHLLLTNNNISKLPNELGLVINLKALQVADNPLIYPCKKIIQEGTKAIKRYLKEQYEIEWTKNANEQKETRVCEEFKKNLTENEKQIEMQEEKLIMVHEEESNVTCQSNRLSREGFENTNKFNKNPKFRESTTSQKQKNNKHLQKADPNDFFPTLYVKKIEQPNKNLEEALKIVHNVSKSESKVLLKSYLSKSGINNYNNLSKIPENMLKEGWLNNLKILLNDQERILQQERNLRALSSWRQRSPVTPKTFNESELSIRRSEAPYATDPEYSRIPSRAELASQLQMFLRDSNSIASRPIQASHIDLDKVINDLVQQLKEMGNTSSETKSPRSEINHAGKQIQMIVDIHKKLLKLKSTNDVY